jgi:hypothetical protein
VQILLRGHALLKVLAMVLVPREAVDGAMLVLNGFRPLATPKMVSMFFVTGKIYGGQHHVFLF